MKGLKLAALVAVALGITAAAAQDTPAVLPAPSDFIDGSVRDVPDIAVKEGTLSGIIDNGARSYRNIPFAAPPAGPLRFAPPAPPVAWTGTRDATRFGPACMQQATRPNGPWSAEFFADPPFSEDCLSLNVWTTGGSGKAILLFVPGGGFTQGGGGEVIYNGAVLAKAGIVAVTMNYRLGAAGFLALSDLAPRGPRQASGNYALWDIVAALRWLKANAAAFGGDPGKITIMGQSAGAQAIVTLLQAPQAKGLFRAAIIDSGVRAGARPMPLAAAEIAAQAWAKSRNAETAAALRALPAEALVPRSGDVRLAPSIDGDLIPDVPMPETSMLDVPVMTGWNGGEGTGSGPQPDLTTANYPQRVTAIGGTTELYPAGADPVAALRAAGHDSTMISAAAWARARAGKVTSPLYLFDFEQVMPGYTAADWGAYHSSELPYFFGTLGMLAGRTYTGGDNLASRLIRGYFLNFITTGDPNSRNLPFKWRPFDPARDEVMALSHAPGMRPITSPQKAALWRSRLERP